MFDTWRTVRPAARIVGTAVAMVARLAVRRVVKSIVKRCSVVSIVRFVDEGSEKRLLWRLMNRQHRCVSDLPTYICGSQL